MFGSLAGAKVSQRLQLQLLEARSTQQRWRRSRWALPHQGCFAVAPLAARLNLLDESGVRDADHAARRRRGNPFGLSRPAARWGARRAPVSFAISQLSQRQPISFRSSPSPVNLLPCCRRTASPCKGVFITLRVTNASPLHPRPQVRGITPGEELRKTAASSGRRPMPTKPSTEGL